MKSSNVQSVVKTSMTRENCRVCTLTASSVSKSGAWTRRKAPVDRVRSAGETFRFHSVALKICQRIFSLPNCYFSNKFRYHKMRQSSATSAKRHSQKHQAKRRQQCFVWSAKLMFVRRVVFVTRRSSNPRRTKQSAFKKTLKRKTSVQNVHQHTARNIQINTLKYTAVTARQSPV